jgi:kynureninase
MELSSIVNCLRKGLAPEFPPDANTIGFAQKLDSQDSLRYLREEFIIPTKASLKKKALDGRIPGTCISDFASAFGQLPRI